MKSHQLLLFTRSLASCPRGWHTSTAYQSLDQPLAYSHSVLQGPRTVMVGQHVLFVLPQSPPPKRPPTMKPIPVDSISNTHTIPMNADEPWKHPLKNIRMNFVLSLNVKAWTIHTSGFKNTPTNHRSTGPPIWDIKEGWDFCLRANECVPPYFEIKNSYRVLVASRVIKFLSHSFRWPRPLSTIHWVLVRPYSTSKTFTLYTTSSSCSSELILHLIPAPSHP